MINSDLILQPILNLQNVTLKVPDLENPILKSIDFQVKSGEFVVILGGNGSGKSSLLKIINQQYLASSGTLHFNGSCSKIATLTQNMQESLFYELTVFENCILREKACIGNLFKKPLPQQEDFFKAHLQSYNPHLSQKMHIKVKQLSGGEKQALMLALCLLNKPQLLLLDEHTSALDPKTAEAIICLTNTLIRSQKITCLMTTHHLSHALQYGDRIIALKNGHLIHNIADTEKQTLTREQLLKFCY